MNEPRRTPVDASSPTLLLVCLVGVLLAVVGIVAVGQTSATAVLFAAIIVLLAGMVVVTRTIGTQLDDADGLPAGRETRSDRKHAPS